jgi:hypothetical protein
MDVHKCISATRNVYAESFDPVQNLIEDSIIIKDGFTRNVIVAIAFKPTTAAVTWKPDK